MDAIRQHLHLSFAYPICFGFIPTAVAWDGMPVNGAPERGYLLERRDLAGTVTAVIEVSGVARAVTPAMRDSVISQELAQARQYAEAGALQDAEREAREAPIADTLPAFDRLMVGDDGLLWAIDYHIDWDPGWSATAFREDGAIVRRLTGIPGRPWVLSERRVVVREEDADGVVRFGVYRVGSQTQLSVDNG